MTENPYKDDLSRFSVTFVRAVITWNHAEEAARQILRATSAGGLGMLAAITHLGNRGLQDSLLTIADYWDDPDTPHVREVAKHIQHFVEGMDTLRAYRNFYVHSLYSTGNGAHDGKFTGLLVATEAKGRYSWVRQYVTIDELEAFMGHCFRLSEYGQAIANYTEKGNTLAALADKPPPPKQPLSSLQKPQWPEKLKKGRSYLLERQPPQKPSRGK